MRRYVVHLVTARQLTVLAGSVEAAEAVALAEAMERWPDCGQWLVSDTEEEA